MKILLAALALLGLVACAHARKSADSAQFRACRAVCDGEGNEVDAVVENSDTLACFCKKPQETM